MKKKLIVLILAVALLTSMLLTGCTFFKVNNERKSNEVLATVSCDYEGQKLELTVTRNELVSYVQYIINLYNSYGMSYDAATLVEQGLDGLIGQKYMILQGMIELMNMDHRKSVMYLNTPEYKAVYGDKITPEGVLTMAERYDAIATTNETFIKNIETYVEEYETEQRERLVSNAREKLAALYAGGYAVKENGTTICYLDADDKYQEGLYKTSFIYDADRKVEPDYKEIYLKIVLEKSGADDETVHLPVSETAVTTEADEEAEFVSNYLTDKICIVSYDEPKKTDSEDTYVTHTAKASFKLVTPRTAFKEKEDEDERDEATKLADGDVKFRYNAFTGELSDELKEIVKNGKIFDHSPTVNADGEALTDAEKDAYRRFREAKKNLLINFDPEKKDAYNSLGYYYLSSFESAVLSAMQHELKRAALSSPETAITDGKIEAQYKIQVDKQKEEYIGLDNMGQIKKFAEIIGSDLTNAYYVPIQAMLAETFKYDADGDGVEEEYSYAIDNGDGTYTINMFYITHILFKWTDELKADMESYIRDRDDEEIKEIKTLFVDHLTTNPSQLGFATAEEKGETLADAFEVDADGNIKSVKVSDALVALQTAMAASEDPLATFQEFMTKYNDDGGSMASKLGYFVAMGDIPNTYDGEDFPNMAKDLYMGLIATGDPNGSKQISDFAFTSYGLHIEYISFAPFYNITLDANGGLGIDFKLDLDGTVFRTSLKETLENNVQSTQYSAWTSKYSNDDALKNAKKDEKKLKNLLKDLGLSK